MQSPRWGNRSLTRPKRRGNEPRTPGAHRRRDLGPLSPCAPAYSRVRERHFRVPKTGQKWHFRTREQNRGTKGGGQGASRTDGRPGGAAPVAKRRRRLTRIGGARANNAIGAALCPCPYGRARRARGSIGQATRRPSCPHGPQGRHAPWQPSRGPWRRAWPPSSPGARPRPDLRQREPRRASPPGRRPS